MQGGVCPLFLAMTAEEIQDISPLPSKFAWLGCHFSTATAQLSGLPSALPVGCGLILDDRTPIPDTVSAQIWEEFRRLAPAFLLLDFQRPPTAASQKLASAMDALPFPTPMPPTYARELDCPVFLPPVPAHVPIADYIKPWSHREVWLELALDGVQISITPQGGKIAPITHAKPAEKSHTDSMLHCHYSITPGADSLEFYCYRTREDITNQLNAPLPPNITHTIGLYQELAWP